MTHAQLTDAVRAAELLAPTSAERHGVYTNRYASCPNPACVDGEVFYRHDWFDPQTEDSEECRMCGGTGTMRRAA